MTTTTPEPDEQDQPDQPDATANPEEQAGDHTDGGESDGGED